MQSTRSNTERVETLFGQTRNVICRIEHHHSSSVSGLKDTILADAHRKMYCSPNNTNKRLEHL